MPPAPPLAELLRSRGLRVTASRQLVLDAVYALGHATAEQVHAAVAERVAGVNITTVYRALELLEELGLVTHIHLSHGAPTYHPAVGGLPHVHLVCHECGAIDEIDPDVLEPLAGELARHRGFRLDFGHAALFGACSRCEGSSSTAAESSVTSTAAESSAAPGPVAL